MAAEVGMEKNGVAAAGLGQRKKKSEEMTMAMEEEEKINSNSKMIDGGGVGNRRWSGRAEAEEGGGVEIWRPSANLSIETVNALPARVKRYYQDIVGWGEALPGYATAAMAAGASEYERTVAEYRKGASQTRLWQAAYIMAFCNNLRTLLRDYNRWMLQHWPVVVHHILLHPDSDATFHHLAETLRFMNDSSVPIREALYVFRKISIKWY